jgi:hypothetical protein
MSDEQQRLTGWRLDVAQAIDRGVAMSALQPEDAASLAADGEEIRWERCLMRPDPLMDDCRTLPAYVARLVEEATHVLVEATAQGEQADLDLLKIGDEITCHAYHLAALVGHGAYLDWPNPEGERWLVVPRQARREGEEGHTD